MGQTWREAFLEDRHVASYVLGSGAKRPRRRKTRGTGEVAEEARIKMLRAGRPSDCGVVSVAIRIAQTKTTVGALTTQQQTQSIPSMSGHSRIALRLGTSYDPMDTHCRRAWA